MKQNKLAFKWLLRRVYHHGVCGRSLTTGPVTARQIAAKITEDIYTGSVPGLVAGWFKGGVSSQQVASALAELRRRGLFLSIWDRRHDGRSWLPVSHPHTLSSSSEGIDSYDVDLTRRADDALDDITTEVKNMPIGKEDMEQVETQYETKPFLKAKDIDEGQSVKVVDTRMAKLPSGPTVILELDGLPPLALNKTNYKAIVEKYRHINKVVGAKLQLRKIRQRNPKTGKSVDSIEVVP